MNPLRKLFASVIKEFRVIARDRAGLALLFVMPLGFVTVMSLALQDVLAQPDAAARLRFSMVVLNGDEGPVGEAIVAELADLDFVRVAKLPYTNLQQASAGLREQVRTGQERLALIIPSGLSVKLDAVLAEGSPAILFDAPPDKRITLDLLVDPALRADFRLLVTIAIERILQGIEIQRAMAGFAGAGLPRPLPADSAVSHRHSGVLSVNSGTLVSTAADGAATAIATTTPMPTSTQQNVPAYCLLAIFMLVVPLSQTFIGERTQGSLTRLQSMPVPVWVIVGGKFVPYFMINLLQMALCLGIGRFVLPLMGASPLHFGHVLGGVLLLSAATSFAAIAFALVVALFARTAEQATAFGGTSVLLLGALGGIMVPRILMPPVLQKIGLISPLGWAQDGFLALFVRGAGAVDVLGQAGGLVAFAVACMGLAVWRLASSDNA